MSIRRLVCRLVRTIFFFHQSPWNLSKNHPKPPKVDTNHLLHPSVHRSVHPLVRPSKKFATNAGSCIRPCLGQNAPKWPRCGQRRSTLARRAEIRRLTTYFVFTSFIHFDSFLWLNFPRVSIRIITDFFKTDADQKWPEMTSHPNGAGKSIRSNVRGF